MTTKEAVNILSQVRGIILHNSSWLESTHDPIKESFDMAISALELEKTWIPVSEKLPEKERKTYWCCEETGYQFQCRWSNDVFGFGESDRWGWVIVDVPQYSHVVAWMPLPESYREEGKE